MWSGIFTQQSDVVTREQEAELSAYRALLRPAPVSLSEQGFGIAKMLSIIHPITDIDKDGKITKHDVTGSEGALDEADLTPSRFPGKVSNSPDNSQIDTGKLVREIFCKDSREWSDIFAMLAVDETIADLFVAIQEGLAGKKFGVARK